MSDTTAIANDPAARPPRFTAEHAREIGLPSAEAINYMTKVASLVSNSVLFTPDLMGGLKAWDGRAPQGHYIPKDGENPCPCEMCYHRARVAESIRANALAKMLRGWELGMKPMESLQEFKIIKDGFSLHYAKMIGLLEQAGFHPEFLERTGKICRLRVTKTSGTTEDVSFSLEDAEQAGLVGNKNDKYNQYQLRPKVMLTARAVSEAWRLVGMPSGIYTPEEGEEIGAGDTVELRENGGASASEFRVGKKEQPAAAAAQPATDARATGETPTGGPPPEPASAPAPPEPKTEAPPPAQTPPPAKPPVQAQAPAALAAEEGLKKEIDARLFKIYSRLGMDTTSAQKRLANFARGYYAVTNTPKELTDWPAPLDALLAWLETQPQGQPITMTDAEAKALGATLKVQADAKLPKLVEDLFARLGWSHPDLPARAAAAMRKLNQNAKEFIEWITYVQITERDAKEAAAFLYAAAHTREAHRLNILTRHYGVTIAYLVAEVERRLGKPLPEVAAEQIEAAIATLEKEYAAAKPTPAEEGDDGLPFDK